VIVTRERELSRFDNSQNVKMSSSYPSVKLPRFENSRNAEMIVLNSVPFFVFVTWTHLKQLRRPNLYPGDGVGCLGGGSSPNFHSYEGNFKSEGA
jgi:hypothetical protein